MWEQPITEAIIIGQTLLIGTLVKMCEQRHHGSIPRTKEWHPFGHVNIGHVNIGHVNIAHVNIAHLNIAHVNIAHVNIAHRQFWPPSILPTVNFGHRQYCPRKYCSSVVCRIAIS